MRYVGIALLGVVFLCLVGAGSADEISNEISNYSSCHQTTVVYRQYTLTRSLGLEPIVEIGVGLLALILFVISVLAYSRDRRTKFLIVCIAFLIFSVKGGLGVLDLFFPRDASMLGTFSDLLDFVILFLLFVAVMKD